MGRSRLVGHYYKRLQASYLDVKFLMLQFYTNITWLSFFQVDI